MSILVATIFLAAIAAPVALLLLATIDGALTGIQSLATGKKARQAITELIAAHQPAAGRPVFYDLGCAYGSLARYVADRFREFRVAGLDRNGFRVFCARLLGFLRMSRARFVVGDLWTRSLRDADIIYIYLPRPLLPRLEEKLRRELKPGAIVITNTVPFPTWPPLESRIVHQRTPDFERLFVYRA